MARRVVLEDLLDAFEKLGGAGDIRDVQDEVMRARGGMTGYKTEDTFRATVQSLVERHCAQSYTYERGKYLNLFERISHGRYRVRKLEGTPEDIETMLLEVRRRQPIEHD